MSSPGTLGTALTDLRLGSTEHEDLEIPEGAAVLFVRKCTQDDIELYGLNPHDDSVVIVLWHGEIGWVDTNDIQWDKLSSSQW